jgi:hypothetical protein
MTTALQLAQRTIATKPTSSYYRGGMSYCQQFAGEAWETHHGVGTPNSYPSADAAYRASSIVSRNPDTAPPGAFHWFAYGNLGHVGLALGSGLMASGTGRSAGALMNLGKSVYVHRVSTYGLTYLGWSRTNGARKEITGLTDHQAPVVAPNQRQVKSDATARRRSLPSTTLGKYIESENLAANKIITPLGYVTSTYAGGTPNQSNKWLVVGDKYVHVSGMTSTSVANLKDLGVLPAPKPIYSVEFVFGPDNIKLVPVTEGLTVGRPGDPERDEFIFEGWAIDGVQYDFSKPVTGNLRIEALWSAKPPEIMTVTFDTNIIDSVVTTKTVEKGTVVEESWIPQPVWEGRSFIGWYDEDAEAEDPTSDGEPEAVDWTLPIDRDMTVYAQWLRDPDPEPTDPDEIPSWFMRIIQSFIEWLTNLGKTTK